MWALLTDEDKAKGKAPPPYATLPTMRMALRQTLGNRKCLLVVDDVWSAAHLKPFLEDTPYSARLITTRDASTLDAQTDVIHRVDVTGIRRGEATALLAANLPPGNEGLLSDLASSLGDWPILLRLV